MFHNVFKVVLYDGRNLFARFSGDDARFSWQAQHFGDLRHFAWQEQHFGRDLLRFFFANHIGQVVTTCKLRGRRGTW